MSKRKIPTQLFKKRCTRCDIIYRPSGKYNKLCPKCLKKAMDQRKKSIEKANKLRKLNNNRKV